MTFAFRAALGKVAVPQILAEVLMALVLVVFAFWRMTAVGVNLAGIVTTSAVVTGVLAFSLQETLGNLWGGIQLQLDNTCRIGDWIQVDNGDGAGGRHPVALHGRRDQQRRDRHHPQRELQQGPRHGAGAARRQAHCVAARSRVRRLLRQCRRPG